MHKPKVMLVVLDGWGYSPVHEGNAIWSAKTPTFDYLCEHYDHILLNAFGENVGLPWGSIGSSEVGHSAIGAGKLIFQELSMIDKEISNRDFFKNKIILDFINETSKSGGDIHLVGLVSNGGVHSHIEHLYGLLEMLKQRSFKANVFIHMISDGRDTGPEEALEFVGDVNKAIRRSKLNAHIASISGRYYAMDRDNRWERTKKAYLAITEGEGEVFDSAEEVIKSSYEKNISDEFIVPALIKIESKRSGLIGKIFNKKKNSEDKKLGTVKAGDSVIFFNTRADRMRQTPEMFLFARDDVKTKPKEKLNVMTMATYNEFLPVKVAYPTEKVLNPLARILSDHKLKQGHFAETEKYVHVTYFFNGANPDKFPGESWNIVSSPKVATYDLKPEMSAKEVTDKVIQVTNKEKLDFVLINYANADMVGHTGVFKAVVKAVEALDKELKRLLEYTPETTIIITADHGNAECMVHPETGEIDKHHTVNPVPMIIVNPDFVRKSEQSEELEPTGILADIAPTILNFFGIAQPTGMNGVSLINNFTHREEKSEAEIIKAQKQKLL